MKGKLLIEPGFKAGGKFCEGCCRKTWSEDRRYCLQFSQFIGSFGEERRCQQCLDADKKDEV